MCRQAFEREALWGQREKALVLATCSQRQDKMCEKAEMF